MPTIKAVVDQDYFDRFELTRMIVKKKMKDAVIDAVDLWIQQVEQCEGRYVVQRPRKETASGG